MSPSQDSEASGRLPQRIEELEVRSTFQEDQIDSLHKALYQQSLVIEQLERKVEAFAQTLRAGQGQTPLPDNETPPHY